MHTNTHWWGDSVSRVRRVYVPPERPTKLIFITPTSKHQEITCSRPKRPNRSVLGPPCSKNVLQQQSSKQIRSQSPTCDLRYICNHIMKTIIHSLACCSADSEQLCLKFSAADFSTNVSQIYTYRLQKAITQMTDLQHIPHMPQKFLQRLHTAGTALAVLLHVSI